MIVHFRVRVSECKTGPTHAHSDERITWKWVHPLWNVSQSEATFEAACSPDSLQRNTFKEVLFRCHRLVGREESIYPIHAAAELGDIKLLRSLLAAGADPQQRTSQGHLPIDFALAHDLNGSHDDVIALLEEDVCITNLRDAFRVMQENNFLQ
ncbi:unnamed protein product [Durusdinium trenchii]|uniref:Uncharacterized protein n=1 Tax=Durusdinium trenchii TaxID=1381693 RepID=A0ABP0NR29_9DINO